MFLQKKSVRFSYSVARIPKSVYTSAVVELPATIQNSAGIHCRPSACIVKALSGYPGQITVISPAGECDPRSIMELIRMGLGPGSTILIRVEGPDEEEQCARLVELFETHYDFPHRDLGQDTQAILTELGARPKKD